jgi:hypothetical protein
MSNAHCALGVTSLGTPGSGSFLKKAADCAASTTRHELAQPRRLSGLGLVVIAVAQDTSPRATAGRA